MESFFDKGWFRYANFVRANGRDEVHKSDEANPRTRSIVKIMLGYFRIPLLVWRSSEALGEVFGVSY